MARLGRLFEQARERALRAANYPLSRI
jgi:hypothetical protein